MCVLFVRLFDILIKYRQFLERLLSVYFSSLNMWIVVICAKKAQECEKPNGSIDSVQPKSSEKIAFENRGSAQCFVKIDRLYCIPHPIGVIVFILGLFQ